RSGATIKRTTTTARNMTRLPDLIRKRLVHRRVRQLDQEPADPLGQDVHESPPFLGGRGAGVAETRILADQVPGAGDAHPTAVDRLELRRFRGPVVGQLRAEQLWEEGEAEAGFDFVGVLAGAVEKTWVLVHG